MSKNKQELIGYFGVEHIPEEIKNFIVNKNITTTLFRVEGYNSIMYGYFCIEFIDFMLKGKCLLEYTNLFSHVEYKNNDKIILKHFQQILKRFKRKKSIVLFLVNIENLKPLKDRIILKKTLAFSIIYSKCSNEDKKIFENEESIEIVKLLHLTINIEVQQTKCD